MRAKGQAFQSEDGAVSGFGLAALVRRLRAVMEKPMQAKSFSSDALS